MGDEHGAQIVDRPTVRVGVEGFVGQRDVATGQRGQDRGAAPLRSQFSALHRRTAPHRHLHCGTVGATGAWSRPPDVGFHARTATRYHRRLMNHGDLVPGIVLVSEGHLAGVLDVAGPGPADRIGSGERVAPVRRGAAPGIPRSSPIWGLEWERGSAWAFQQAMGLAWYYADSNPVMSRIGRRTLDRLTSDVP